MSYRDFFNGKRVTVMGLGLLGRGVGDAEFLAECGAEVLVTDEKTEEQLKESVERLRKFSNVSFRLGEHKEEDFTQCDMVLKAAGVPLDSPYIAAAKKAGVPAYMSTALFAKFASDIGATIVGVTGTRGKSTVAHMIYYSLIRTRPTFLNHEVILETGSTPVVNKRIIHLGGNIQGISTLALLPKINKGDIAVLELDSWQLQGFGDLQLSPRIAVFTNLYPDHQNYYSSMDTYFDDKANIFKHQESDDTLIAGEQVVDRIRKTNPPIDPIVPAPLPSDWILKIPGEHNRSNAALAVGALKALGLSDDQIRAGLESFEGVEGRLQYIGESNGVKIYNDNNATTPEATIAALKAVGNPEEKNVVLIIGGDDKKLDMSGLVEEIPKHCSKVVMFKERGTDRIRDQVSAMKDQGLDVYEEEGLNATVDRAFKVAKPGEILLYSPAFSSFGKYFKNEFDRGDQFVTLAKKYGVHVS